MLLPKSSWRPGPKSVSPATNCSGVEVVVYFRWLVAIACSLRIQGQCDGIAAGEHVAHLLR